MKAGRLDEAIADYDRAIAITPKFAAALYGRAQAKRQKGAGADADQAAARALDPAIEQNFGK